MLYSLDFSYQLPFSSPICSEILIFGQQESFYVVAVLCRPIDVVSAPLYSSERYTRSSNCSVLLPMRVDVSRCYAAMIYVWTERRIREFDSKD